MNIGCPQTQFSGTLLEDDATRKRFLELPCYLSSIVRTPIINNDDFIFKLAV
jgi:hypothetical protein